MEITLSDIAANLNQCEPVVSDRRIDVLLTDSRSLSDAAHTLFFALVTPHNDGHRYLRQLYEAGVRAFVVSCLPDWAVEAVDTDFLIVKDTLMALQQVALCHRQRFVDTEVVGITGSKGKTIVKEWLFQALASTYRITRSPRSYNSQMGVPLSVWQLGDDTQLGVFEAGVSRSGEMERIAPIISPTIGVFTSLGHEHDDGFESQLEKCREKFRLFENAGTVVYPGDDDVVRQTVDELRAGKRLVAWSRRIDGVAVKVVEEYTLDGKTTILTLDVCGSRKELRLSFVLSHLIDDALTVFTTMIALGRPVDEAVTRVESLSRVGTRLSLVEGVNHTLLVLDQNAVVDYHSLSTAIDFVAPRLTPGLSLTLVVGDVAHETMNETELYGALARMLRLRGVTRLIGGGVEINRYRSVFAGLDTEIFDSPDEMVESLSSSDFSNEIVILAGAKTDRLERLVPKLEARRHETVLEVDLDALVHNFNYFRSLLRPTTGIICMVKASGYGAGSYELAKTLQAQGASYLAVAVVDEGVELRQRGITMPVMVMNPKVTNYPVLFANNLEPEIYSLDILREIIAQGRRYGVKEYPVHIKIDSGMHRLGFTIDEMPAVIELLRSQDVVTPVSVFSHLAAADMPEEDEYTRSQFEYFDRCADMLSRAFAHRRILRHILNSTGIIRFPEHQCDMVRLGLGLYGVSTMPGDPRQDCLQPIGTLRTVIISIKQWPAGTTIGYSRRGVLSRQSVIATLPIGYADGLDRQLGYGNASFMVNGHRCPTVGSICMDLCMIDVTDCTTAAVGDTVEIFGRDVTAVELGDRLNTISYEVLTSVSQRVKRVYYRE